MLVMGSNDENAKQQQSLIGENKPKLIDYDQTAKEVNMDDGINFN